MLARQTSFPLTTAILSLFLSLSLPLAGAIPSSTHPQADAVTRGSIHHSTLQNVPIAVFAAARDSLKQSIHEWSNPPAVQELKSTYPEPTEPPRHLYAQYGDQLVLRFNISTTEEAASLAEAADILFLDVWESSVDWVDIRIAGDVLQSLLGLLPPSMQHAHTPLMTGRELTRAIADTYPSSTSQSDTTAASSHRSYRGFAPSNGLARETATDVFFDDYRSLAVIVHWMRLLQSLFSTHVKVISVGQTSEGRDIWALKAGVQPNNAQSPTGPRKTIIVSGGLHAREWISTSSVNYMAYSLVSQYGRDAKITKLLEDFDWILIPTLNPDGYHHTWEADRLWRKSRQTTNLRFCRGMDLDRTYGFKWDGARTTDNPCSESFAGHQPFEATESASFSAWAKNQTQSHNVEFVGLLDLHSYSEQILYPYSFSCQDSPPNVEDLAELGQGLAKAIRSGTSRENYKVIPACEGNVAMSGGGARQPLSKNRGGGGSLLDWFYHEMGVKLAFQIKLRDKGSYGFLLPRHYIVPTGVEALNALRYFGKQLSAESLAADEDGYRARGGQAQEPLI